MKLALSPVPVWRSKLESAYQNSHSRVSLPKTGPGYYVLVVVLSRHVPTQLHRLPLWLALPKASLSLAEQPQKNRSHGSHRVKGTGTDIVSITTVRMSYPPAST